MLRNLYITNYCDKRCSPLTSITRLAEEEAYSLAARLSRYSGDTFTSFSRFNAEDFEGYYKKRMRTEEWLYHSFISLGHKPKNAHPLYFVLGESNYLNDWFQHGMKIKLALNDIASDDISFTYGDSMSIIDREDRMELFNKETLENFLQEQTSDLFTYLNDLNEHNQYIEVQLWNDVYIEDVIHKESI